MIGHETPTDWDTETGEATYADVIPLPNEPSTEDDELALPLGKEWHSGQLRIAERFVTAYAQKLLFVHGLGWHYWAGTHWVEDKNGKARRRVVALLKLIRHEAADMGPGKTRDALLKDARLCESNGGITGVLELAKHMHPMTVSAESVNGNAYLFNALNGTMNLKTGILQAHNPRNMITKCAGAQLRPDAHSALWEQFLDQVLPDEAVRRYLQRVFGVAMLGEVLEHNLPILTGTGGNGKGVACQAVLEAFGDYGITVDPQLIMKTKHERHATFMADLHGARLVVTSETNEGAVMEASTVKRLTGGDKIRANRMRENSFEFAPSHSLVYMTNHKPKVSADDKAMWRRLSIVPFDVTVQEVDVHLPDKLRAQLPAVLAWAYQGWLDYQVEGLNPPGTVLERTETYRGESDPVALFVADECVVTPNARTQSKKLYDSWSAWAMTNGHEPITQVAFTAKIVGYGHEKKRGTGGAVVFVGIGLASNEEDTPAMFS